MHIKLLREVIARFHRNSCYPNATEDELDVIMLQIERDIFDNHRNMIIDEALKIVSRAEQSAGTNWQTRYIKQSLKDRKAE